MKTVLMMLAFLVSTLTATVSLAKSKLQPKVIATWDVSADEQLSEQLLVKLEQEFHPRNKFVLRVYQVTKQETHLLKEEKASSEITSKGKKAFKSNSILVEEPDSPTATIRFSTDISSITGQTQILARGIYDLRAVMKMKGDFSKVADLKN